MLVRLKITLEQADFTELLRLALSELRTPESQIIHILRNELSLHKPGVNNSVSTEVQDNSFCGEVPNGK